MAGQDLLVPYLLASPVKYYLNFQNFPPFSNTEGKGNTKGKGNTNTKGNSLNMQKQYEHNVCEKSNDALSIRVHTTLNHISICFLPQYQRQRKFFFSELELEKALHR